MSEGVGGNEAECTGKANNRKGEFPPVREALTVILKAT